jgi:hypothetical protein
VGLVDGRRVACIWVTFYVGLVTCTGGDSRLCGLTDAKRLVTIFARILVLTTLYLGILEIEWFWLHVAIAGRYDIFTCTL